MGLHVRLAKPVAAALRRWRQLESSSRESGGILLGKTFECGNVAEVHAITSPFARDKRSRTRFSRRDPTHQMVADTVHAAHAGRIGYLGGWHTHPEDDPSPSTIDRRDWRRAVRDDIYTMEWLLFIIVGRERTRAWVMVRGTKTEVEVTLE